jgi:hypothetical protein
MTRRPTKLRKRACTFLPKQPQGAFGTVLSWLVDTDNQFRRAQAKLHPPGRWP